MAVSQLVLDGAAIKAIFDSITSALTSVALSIMSAIFAVFFDWVVALIGGSFFSNPAPVLIGVIFLVTAWKVHTSG